MNSRTLVFRFAYLALLLAASWLFLWNLGAHSISIRSDEVIYVRVTQAILHNGDLFPLMHGSAPMYEKPPLKLWLGSLAPIVFGESNGSFRLLDGLLGIATVLLSVALMRRISRSVWLALLSGALLLGMPELVISHHGFRRAVLDGLLTVLTVLVAYGAWRLVETRMATAAGVPRSQCAHERACAIGLGALCSLAVLTKSIAGFVPALCAVVSVVVASPRGGASWLNRIRDERALLWIVLLPVLAFLGYCAALWLIAGQKALGIFIGVEVFTRVFSGFEGHNTGNPWFYLWSLFVRGAAVPRTLLIVGVLGVLLALKTNRGVRFLLVWAALPVTLYSFSASKAPWYLNPFLPFVSMVAVGGTEEFLTRVAATWAWAMGQVRGHSVARTVMRSGVVLVAIATVPAFARAVQRHVAVVLASNERIEIDSVVQSLRNEYSQFAIVENALSGRSNPRNGRFNVEGIYREMLKPRLRTVATIEEFTPVPHEVIFVKEESRGRLPTGWRQIGSVAPYTGRAWRVVVVVYDGYSK
jgi:4-amino-4-deoxy-L-arabinose transferase-like glycosyltransferase